MSVKYIPPFEELFKSGDLILIANDTEKLSTAHSESDAVAGNFYKGIRLKDGGEIKVYFELRIGGTGYTAKARIYKNTTPTDFTFSTTSTTYVPFELILNDLKPGDEIRIYFWSE